MPKLKFIANWSLDYQSQFQIPKGYILLKYNEFYRQNLGKTLLKLDGWQQSKMKKLLESGQELTTKDYLRDLEITLEYHYKKRTLDQNALMWSLYDIEAHEQNGGMFGHSDQNVTKDDLYYNDLMEFGERETITTKVKNLRYYQSEFKIIECVLIEGNKEIELSAFLERIPGDNEMFTLRGIRGSSKFTTKEMANWIDRIFNRLAYSGVSLENSGQIAKYWHDWRKGLNDNKVLLHEEIMTQDEYKEANPICEACGQYIQEGQGELSHIQSVGMGGDRNKEPARNYTSNWLHLHAQPCHRKYWHEFGVQDFINRFEHLKHKIESALKRTYKPLKDNIDINIENDHKTQHGQPSAANSQDLKQCRECKSKHSEDICPYCKGQGLF